MSDEPDLATRISEQIRLSEVEARRAVEKLLRPDPELEDAIDALARHYLEAAGRAHDERLREQNSPAEIERLGKLFGP